MCKIFCFFLLAFVSVPRLRSIRSDPFRRSGAGGNLHRSAVGSAARKGLLTICNLIGKAKIYIYNLDNWIKYLYLWLLLR